MEARAQLSPGLLAALRSWGVIGRVVSALAVASGPGGVRRKAEGEPPHGSAMDDVGDAARRPPGDARQRQPGRHGTP